MFKSVFQYLCEPTRYERYCTVFSKKIYVPILNMKVKIFCPAKTEKDDTYFFFGGGRGKPEIHFFQNAHDDSFGVFGSGVGEYSLVLGCPWR